MHSAIITTAARTHWRHDFTGRDLPRPANEPQAALDTPRAVNCAKQRTLDFLHQILHDQQWLYYLPVSNHNHQRTQWS